MNPRKRHKKIQKLSRYENVGQRRLESRASGQRKFCSWNGKSEWEEKLKIHRWYHCSDSTLFVKTKSLKVLKDWRQRERERANFGIFLWKLICLSSVFLENFFRNFCLRIKWKSWKSFSRKCNFHHKWVFTSSLLFTKRKRESCAINFFSAQLSSIKNYQKANERFDSLHRSIGYKIISWIIQKFIPDIYKIVERKKCPAQRDYTK